MEDVRLKKQDIKKLYGNQISQYKDSKWYHLQLPTFWEVLINENIVRIKQIVSKIIFINNDMIDSIMN